MVETDEKTRLMKRYIDLLIERKAAIYWSKFHVSIHHFAYDMLRNMDKGLLKSYFDVVVLPNGEVYEIDGVNENNELVGHRVFDEKGVGTRSELVDLEGLREQVKRAPTFETMHELEPTIVDGWRASGQRDEIGDSEFEAMMNTGRGAILDMIEIYELTPKQIETIMDFAVGHAGSEPEYDVRKLGYHDTVHGTYKRLLSWLYQFQKIPVELMNKAIGAGIALEHLYHYQELTPAERKEIMEMQEG